MSSASIITGVGRALPDHVVTNDEVAARLGVEPGWIETRTGIRERRIAVDGETTSSLGAAAASEAIGAAGLTPADIDFVLTATCTPDHAFPSAAAMIQHRLGCENAGAIDINAACSGFLYGLAMANGLIASGAMKRIVVIGAEIMSRVVDQEDSMTAPLFGDGAGAAVLEASPEGDMEFILGADGAGAENVILPAGGSARPASVETVEQRQHYVRMAGRDVYKSAVRSMVSMGSVLGKDGFDILIGHQANARILLEAAEHLGVEQSKLYMNIERIGNTSAASIPIAIYEAWQEGRLTKGQRLLLLAFGAGYTSAGARMTWPLASPISTEAPELEEVPA